VLCLALAWPAIERANPQAPAQAPGRASDPRGQIRVDVSLVNVLASALDKSGRPATDLSRDQFELYEEGKLQKIEVFEPETNQPLDLALMVDSSLSEVKDMDVETAAAARFISRIVRPGDRVAVYEFSDAVTQLAAFSDNVPRLQTAVKHIEPGDGTALYDAVFLGSQALERGGVGRRRALVLLTDAGETTSRADFETARRAAVRAEALLYTIVIRPVHNENGRNTAGEHALETIADTTGGAMYYPNEVTQLDAMFERIDRELRTQYRLGFYPQPRPPLGAYRQIEVRVKGDYTVRYRKTYYSGGPPE
jgi:Ca-activated chloride channel family protein